MVTQPLTLVFQDGTVPAIVLPKQQDLIAPQGGDARIPFRALQANGAPKDLTGYTLTLKVRDGGATGTVVATCIADEDGTPTGEIDAPVTGAGYFLIGDDVSAPLAGSYAFDVFSNDGSGGKDQLLPDSWFQFTPSVGA